MKLAIVDYPGSFSDRWIEYCEENRIQYDRINSYATDVIETLKGYDGILWHWVQTDYRSVLFAKQFCLAVIEMGIKSYPDVNTCWHFDDKVGQKYLLEAIDAPLAPSYVFYNRIDALKWIEKTTFPKVFKLRGGAGSVNVRLITNRNQARKLINRAFSKGFKHINRNASFIDKIYRFRIYRNFKGFIGILKGLARFIIPTEEERMLGREKGYIYFQDFIHDNSFDTRLIIIGKRCLACRRYNRKNDFRASGSVSSSYEKELFDETIIKIAFDLSKKLGTQSLAFDFVKRDDEYLLVEISYCFPVVHPSNFKGYWDDQFNWHPRDIKPEDFIIEDFINSFKSVKIE